MNREERIKVTLCLFPSCVYHNFSLQLLTYFKVTATRKLRLSESCGRLGLIISKVTGGVGGGGATFGTLRYSLPRVKNRKVKSRITNEFLSRR